MVIMMDPVVFGQRFQGRPVPSNEIRHPIKATNCLKLPLLRAMRRTSAEECQGPVRLASRRKGSELHQVGELSLNG